MISMRPPPASQPPWDDSSPADYVFALVKALDRVSKKRGRRLIVRGVGRGLDVFEAPLKAKP